MGLYLGKKKLCSYDEKQVTQNSMKEQFSAGFKLNSIQSFKGSLSEWFLPADTSELTTMEQFFYGDYYVTDFPDIDASNCTNFNDCFSYCRVMKKAPLIFNIKKSCTMNYTFSSCFALEEVPAIDCANVTSMIGILNNSTLLSSIKMTNISVSFNISASTKFTESALVEILNNLANVTSTQTLTMGSTNLAKLTDEEKAMATGKGWTLK